MTPQELNKWLKANLSAELIASRNDVAIRDAAVAKLPTVTRSKRIGEQGVLDALGIEGGEAVLQTIEGVAANDHPAAKTFARVVRWLRADPWLDIGSEKVQEALAGLKQGNGGSLPDQLVDLLIAEGREPQSLTVDQVSDALNLDVDWSKHNEGAE